MEGEKCNDDRQCRSGFFAFVSSRTDDLLCNRPTSNTGVCVLESELLRELGAPCNPAKDACDARRGLSCARVGSQFKCIQRGISPDTFNHFCTPNSPLSSCPPDNRGNLRECRRALSLSKQFEGPFSCRTRRQLVPLGNPCSATEFAVCQQGAVCAEVPGVSPPSGRFPPPPLRTCMRLLPVGAACPDQFRFKCEEGSFCVDGTCRKADTPPTVAVTFASVGDECSELSCPPGTVCEGEPDTPEVFKTCKLPVREAGLWQPCFDAAQFRLVSATSFPTPTSR
ncbi:hypothetical protein FGB62_21g06 [Gracilaria domingensis]|nr:hypothetical protein FGB62_21g06 [Gracilaria domingensis]